MDGSTHERFLETLHGECDGRAEVCGASRSVPDLWTRASSRPLTGSMNPPP